MSIKFSIIIPVYNLELFVGQCLDSVMSQTFESWEAIIVNDGSIDKSLEIIQDYVAKDTRIIIINKHNEGLSAARNDAMRICTGDYIIFLDGDDWLDYKALELIYYLIYDKNVDFLVHRMNYYYSSNDCTPKKTKISEGIYDGLSFLHTVLKNKEYNYFVAQSKVYSRKFLWKYSLHFIHGIIHEDGPFFFEVCHKAQYVLFSHNVLYYYRQNREGQITSTKTYNTCQGISRGIDRNIKLYGYADKIVNGAMLDLYTFLIGGYKSNEEEAKSHAFLRSFRTKIRLLRYTYYSKIPLMVRIRGIMLLIDPIVLKYVYKIWFKQ